MPRFEQMPSRAQRAISCDRLGETAEKPAERMYDVRRHMIEPRTDYSTNFDWSRGHMPLTTSSSQSTASPSSSAFARSTSSWRASRGCRSFDKMLPHRCDFVKSAVVDAADLSHALPSRIVAQGIAVQFARPLTRGSDSCQFDKCVTRDRQSRVGYFCEKAPTLREGSMLHVNYEAVEPHTGGPAPWRPSSACSRKSQDDTPQTTRRPSSATTSKPPVHVDPQKGAQASAAANDNPYASFYALCRPLSRNTSWSKAKRW